LVVGRGVGSPLNHPRLIRSHLAFSIFRTTSRPELDKSSTNLDEANLEPTEGGSRMPKTKLVKLSDCQAWKRRTVPKVLRSNFITPSIPREPKSRDLARSPSRLKRCPLWVLLVVRTKLKTPNEAPLSTYPEAACPVPESGDRDARRVPRIASSGSSLQGGKAHESSHNQLVQWAKRVALRSRILNYAGSNLPISSSVASRKCVENAILFLSSVGKAEARDTHGFAVRAIG
jgi:hypothetical protein